MIKRTKRIHFFLDEKEHGRLVRRVSKSGLTLSAYMRHLIAGRIPKDRPPPEYFELNLSLIYVKRPPESLKFQRSLLVAGWGLEPQTSGL